MSKRHLRKRLNISNLTAAILEMVTNQSMIERSREIGQKLSTEDGVGNAVNIIEAYSKNNPS